MVAAVAGRVDGAQARPVLVRRVRKAPIGDRPECSARRVRIVLAGVDDAVGADNSQQARHRSGRMLGAKAVAQRVVVVVHNERAVVQLPRLLDLLAHRGADRLVVGRVLCGVVADDAC